jgi:hypothetical protein
MFAYVSEKRNRGGGLWGDGGGGVGGGAAAAAVSVAGNGRCQPANYSPIKRTVMYLTQARKTIHTLQLPHPL